MNISLTIDCREKKIISELKKQDVSFAISQLPLADFIIKSENDNVIAMFERKTLADLESSILDGRYKEQGQRLNECEVLNHNIIYIIEGDLDKYKPKTRRMKRETLRNAMISCMMFKGFSLVQTKSVQDTGVWITGFLNKMSREMKKGQQLHQEHNKEQHQEHHQNNITLSIKEKTPHVGKQKNANITREHIDEILLQQVPYVSEKSALAILEHFKGETFYDIIKDVRENDAERLKTVKVNGRRISKRIINEMIKLFSHSLE